MIRSTSKGMKVRTYFAFRVTDDYRLGKDGKY